MDRLSEVHDALGSLESWEIPTLHETLEALAERAQVGFGKIAQPIRVALTGCSVSPGIGETLHLLGRERSLARMQKALEKFGPKT